MSNYVKHCPNCGFDLEGDLIWEHFFKEFTEGTGYWCDENGDYTPERRLLSLEEAMVKADDVASNYGATRTEGRWGKAIGIYSMEYDRTVSYQCPNCQHEWKR